MYIFIEQRQYTSVLEVCENVYSIDSEETQQSYYALLPAVQDYFL